MTHSCFSLIYRQGKVGVVTLKRKSNRKGKIFVAFVEAFLSNYLPKTQRVYLYYCDVHKKHSWHYEYLDGYNGLVEDCEENIWNLFKNKNEIIDKIFEWKNEHNY